MLTAFPVPIAATSTFLCALLATTTIAAAPNLVVNYVGMVSSGDYVFQWANFIGVNISVLGSLLYTYDLPKTSSRKS